MSDDTITNPDPETSNTDKPTGAWVTAEEPMTGAQRSYLETLSRETGEPVEEEDLSKAEASRLIDRLRERSDRVAADD